MLKELLAHNIVDQIVNLAAKTQDIKMSKRSRQTKKELVTYCGEWVQVFDKFRDKDGKACLSQIFEEVRSQGIHPCQDPRFFTLFQSIKLQNGKCFPEAKIDFPTFEGLVKNHDLFGRALKKNLVIPDLEEFEKILRLIFLAQLVDNTGTEPKIYKTICNPSSKDSWGLAMFSIEGQKALFGDSDVYFTMQSCSWPLLYAFMLDTVGADEVHQYCSYEPTHASFVITDLTRDGKPFNPLTLGGVLMCCAIWQAIAFPTLTYAEKFEKFLCFLMEMSDGEKLNCNNLVVIDERERAFAVKAVLNVLLNEHCFPPGCDPVKILEFFFQINSIEVNAQKLALMAATLANDGIHPITGKQLILQDNNVNVLSVLQTCGIDHTKDNFLFEVGIPAITASTGAAIFIVPGFFAIACYSPQLESCDMSRRSLKFIKTLATFYNFHPFDNSLYLKTLGGSKQIATTCSINCALFNAATNGELDTVARLITAGTNPGMRDYMKRTILHVAASYGHIALCKFIVANCPNIIDARDIMGRMAIDDAITFEHSEIATFLKNWTELRKGGNEELMKTALVNNVT